MRDDIVVLQLPVIGYEDKLRELKAEIEARTSVTAALECTEETVKEVKKVRAELNKELKEYEDARKRVKKAISEPYDRFNAVYKECVSDVFSSADAQLKAKIDKVENELKEKKRQEVLDYAVELRAALGLEWLEVGRVMPNVTLSATASSLKQKTAEEIDRINTDVGVIDDPEVLAEYKKSLNLAQAQMIVKQRRVEIEKAKAESERKAQQEETKQEVIEKVEMIAPPVVLQEPEEIEDIYEMTFTVNGTIEQLKALKAFMIANNINFTNGGN